ncbi:hypothetical protein OOZ63_08010 [Paucibacter sp. PLA-PC-4]|nr:hypothetical protein [Paucibacter sp. PLA-PC-4]MCX2861781.1 hypothetical protein [Paucibacter sp. PLA-PC-4]
MPRTPAPCPHHGRGLCLITAYIAFQIPILAGLTYARAGTA